MFRMMKLRPPNGWPSVWWELAIVTLGVLIALGAQQWVEERNWSSRVQASQSAIRDELSEHYSWSVEWRRVAPCLLAQIERLQQRVLGSGPTLDPAPIYREALFTFVVRLPSKEYPRSVYDAALGDGVVQRFDSAFRLELNAHYAQSDLMELMTRQNDQDQHELFSLSRVLPLDPSVRADFTRRLDSLRGRVEFMDLVAGQLIDHVQRVRMVPSPAETRRQVERFGTDQFCRAQGLPLHSFARAMTAVPN
jgi:hypothetical protein